MTKAARARESRHIRLYHWLMNTAAWKDLDCVARSAYVELASRYSGTDDKGFSNNGRIPLSLLELAVALGISKQTAMRALGTLQDHGFVAIESKGRFTTGYRQASEWRLTEFPFKGAAATKDFAAWPNLKAGSATKPSRVSTRNASGVDVEQVSDGNRPYGSTTTPEPNSAGSTTTPLVVYHGDEEPAAQRAPQSAVASRGRDHEPILTAYAIGAQPPVGTKPLGPVLTSAPDGTEKQPTALGEITRSLVRQGLSHHG